MKKIFHFLVMFGLIFMLAGCGGEKQESSSENTQSSQVTENYSLKTQEGMEKKLRDLDFPVYSGAKFKKVEVKRGKHSAVYIIPEMTEKAEKEVSEFYSKVFKEMKNSGWESKMEGTSHFDYWYQKGSENITFTHRFLPEYEIHEIYISYQ